MNFRFKLFKKMIFNEKFIEEIKVVNGLDNEGKNLFSLIFKT